MAERRDVYGEVTQAIETAKHIKPETARRNPEQERAKRTQAVALRLAGFTYEQIADKLGVRVQQAHSYVDQSLISTAASSPEVEQMRALENERLDRAQLAIWPEVLKGDSRAINTYLRISGERSKLNGLYAPQKVEMAMSIKHEMERALEELETLVLVPVEDGRGEEVYVSEDDLAGSNEDSDS